jgi:excisionase family DNA binding protein
MLSGQFLPTREAASLLGLSPRTLEKFRLSGEGPAFYKFGRRCLYQKADLDAWAIGRRRLSTSDSGLA